MPSLSDRLKSVEHKNAANKGGCVTCRWWAEISDESRRLINEWIDGDHSVKQLHEILTAPSSGDEPQLEISITGFRLHLNHHSAKCRGE